MDEPSSSLLAGYKSVLKYGQTGCIVDNITLLEYMLYRGARGVEYRSIYTGGNLFGRCISPGGIDVSSPDIDHTFVVADMFFFIRLGLIR